MTTTTTEQLRSGGALASRQEPDQRIDLFSARGFALACKLANAYSSSDAVPAQYRAFNLKKVNGVETWVENTAAQGNCIVAIETAMALGISINQVMQNSDAIEGKLRWSDKFIVAAVNASKRFSDLRFDVVNKGKIKVKYKQKMGWNNAKKGFDFEDVEVEIENLECVAWALPAGVPLPHDVLTRDQARARNLPVIEGPPISIKLTVEEGWYAKSGSKWQTELKHKMIRMRAGRYFGDIYAPDITMGFGLSKEEVEDTAIIDVHPQENGSYAVNLDEMRKQAGVASHAEEVADEVVTDKTTPAEDDAAQPVEATPEGQAAEVVDQQTGEVQQAKPTAREAINAALEKAKAQGQQRQETEEDADFRRSQEKEAAKATTTVPTPTAETTAPVRRTRNRAAGTAPE